MIRFNLEKGGGEPLTIVCLGSHSDDIEIGCGGALLALLERYPGSNVHWVVFSADGVRRAEAERGSRLFTGNGCLRRMVCNSFPDGFMPFVGAEVKALFERLKREVSPDIIFTHYRKDAHQDHRLLSEITGSTFRNHLILEYEIPKYDGDMSSPNLFVPLAEEVCERKVNYILDVFQSQAERHWFRRETFLSLMRLRGMECASPSGYAEGFYCRKAVL